ncbi:amino acid adenylation domain-containing protein [Pedobacter sp. SYP-B3415]|uniref:amino acid adenylation domain-containing protein n=1 Tax=Pedobacter sp. SYP-B3415 TaxID=2496641 RepID=UPI00101BC650|nr:amino acid adenylation domain-containing protein [Pedobacter sp. SYP-B3415]
MYTPFEQNLFTLFDQIAATRPEHPALSFNGQQYTYGQLNKRIDDIAAFLIKNGLQRQAVVGLMMGRSIDLVASMIGILRAGGTYLPIDPALPADRIAFMLKDSGSKLLLVDRSVAGAGAIFDGHELQVPAGEAPATANEITFPKLEASDPAYMIYTSGTSGMPKGVRVSHGNLFNFLLGMQDIFNLGVTDRVLAHTTISFDISGLELYLPLVAGATVYLLDEVEARDGRALIKKAICEKITLIQATPAMWKTFLYAGWDDKLPLKAVSGGEALPADLAAALLPKVDGLWNMYGPTETTIWSACKQILPNEKIISIGLPIRQTTLHVLDEDLNPLPAGQTGEIFIGGRGVSLGYHNRPKLNEERFIHVNGHSECLYRTGDLGYFDEKRQLFFQGRADLQIKVNGYRIEIEEIESQLRKLADIQDAVVGSRTSKSGNKKLVAYVVTQAKGVPVQRDEWNSSLARILPAYMLPAQYISVEAFPLSPSGKIDRKALDAHVA